MALVIGVSLALAVGVLYTAFRLDRDRAFYPTVTIVVASYYALFAVMGASTHTLVLESLAAAVFLLAAVYGFRGRRVQAGKFSTAAKRKRTRKIGPCSFYCLRNTGDDKRAFRIE